MSLAASVLLVGAAGCSDDGGGSRREAGETPAATIAAPTGQIDRFPVPDGAGPASESFTSFPLPSQPSNVRQILGRPGEVWGADTLVRLRT